MAFLVEPVILNVTLGRYGDGGEEMRTWRRVYQISVISLAVVSIALVLLDLVNVVDLSKGVWSWVDDAILGFFTVDYVVRFWQAPNKKAFFKTNFFDLLAIIPFSSLFNFFRLARLMRLLKLVQLFQLIRLVGFINKLRRHLRQFFRTNGFGYLVWASLIILILASSLYAYAERVSWGEAFWWAITTTTTVGYGDVAPHTVAGKWAATVLMIVGIGFIGALTSTITTYFAQRHGTSDTQRLLQELAQIKQQNKELQRQIAALVKQQRP